jgi:hypothetical protein
VFAELEGQPGDPRFQHGAAQLGLVDVEDASVLVAGVDLDVEGHAPKLNVSR